MRLPWDLFQFFFVKPKISFIFAAANAKIAQLVEHDLAKVGVAGSSPVFRSTLKRQLRDKTGQYLPN